MKVLIKFLLVTVALLALLYLTNPPLAKHEEVVDLTVRLNPAQMAEAREKYGMAVGAVGRKTIYYQDYRLFSTTTDDDGGRLSIGILRKVFSLRSTKKDTSK